jgi:DNA-binding transcriptional LysR family regulator
MELRHLRYFAVVAEELHFARAAERLGIEQSPLSRAIRELEEQLGVALLTRTSRGAHLTPAGEAFLVHTRQILADVRQAREKVRALVRGLSSRLRVGVSPGILHPRVARLVARSRAEEPDIDFIVEEMPTVTQLKELREERLDVGLSPLSPSEDLRAELLWTAPVAVILPTQHDLVRQHTITLKQLSQERSIWCQTEVATAYGNLPQVREVYAGSTARCVRASSLPILLEIIGAGCGVGIALAAQLESVRRMDVVTRPLEAQAPPVQTFALVRNVSISAAISRLIERARMIP